MQGRELFMEDALQPLLAVQIKPHKYLALGIAVSVMLHLACVYVLFTMPSGSSSPRTSVTYVDLNAALHPAPAMTVPPREATPPTTAPEPEAPPVPETPPQAQQLQPALPSQPAAVQETRQEEQRSHTVMGLGLTKGYFKSLGEGETLREGVKGYYLEMLQVINEKWWVDQQLDKRRLAPVVVSLTVARNGEIAGIELMRGSGSRSYDKAVMAALAAASPLPPLPASYVGDFFKAPVRLVPPLNLMAW
jgi:periplasmic protein TonB